MVVPVEASKRVLGHNAPSTGAFERALTGDIYVRKWTSVAKKGKKKGVPIDHEVRVNAVTGAVVAVGAAVTAVGLGIALWLTQQKVGKTTEPKRLVRRVRLYEPVYETVTIVDTPERDEVTITYIHGYPKEVVVHYEAVTHEETRLKTAATAIILTQRGVPIKRVSGSSTTNKDELGSQWMNYELEKAEFVYGEDQLGKYTESWNTWKHKTKKAYGIEERKGFGVDLGL